jgi:hypothetical protein
MPQTNTARPRHLQTGYFIAQRLFEGLEDFPELEARIADLPTEKEVHP